MKVLFVTDFSPIVVDMEASKRFYVDVLGLPLEGEMPNSEQIPGVKHFGLWPLRSVAQTCFGTDEWPAHLPIPQANLEFDVDDVSAAAEELAAKGYTLLHPPRREPWSQTMARLISPEGLIVAVCHTPWMREEEGSAT